MRVEAVGLDETSGMQAIFDVAERLLNVSVPVPQFYIPARINFGNFHNGLVRLPLGGESCQLQVSVLYPAVRDYLARFALYGRVGRLDSATDVEPVEDGDSTPVPDRIEARRRAFTRWAGHGLFLHGEVMIHGDHRVDVLGEVAVMETAHENRKFRKSSGREAFDEYYRQTLLT